jgi:hypothetical protein
VAEYIFPFAWVKRLGYYLYLVTVARLFWQADSSYVHALKTFYVF